MFEKILFPVDFSVPCEQIAPVVRAWARRFGAEVTLLYVQESNRHKELEGSGKSLFSFASEEWADLRVVRVEREGHAGHEIVEFARQNAASLIMLPTHGYTRFRQLLLGSVTATILHDSEIPVWTSAHAEAAQPVAEPKRLLCAVDCGPETARVLGLAQEMAERFGATLRVVHASPAVDPRFDSAIAQRAHQLVKADVRDAYAKRVAGMQNPPELEIVEDSSLLEGVTNAIGRYEADLLVIGRGKMQGVMGRLRSNAHDLIRHAPCPVLSL